MRWSIPEYFACPAEYKPVIVELIEEHNREIQKQKERRR